MDLTISIVLTEEQIILNKNNLEKLVNCKLEQAKINLMNELKEFQDARG